MFHIALWFLILAAVMVYVLIRAAPDRPAKSILNEDGWPREFPRNNDEATMDQARRPKVK